VEIAQHTHYVAADRRWDWAIWVDGTESELGEIEAVEYTLHPTFPEPVRLVRNRADKFRLEDSAWGEFEINAHALMKDGNSEHLKHWLHLETPEGERAPEKDARDSPQRVFVSYAAADADWGDAIQRAFAQRGYEATTTDDAIEAGTSWRAAMTSAIDAADLVVAVFSDTPSAWVEREVSEAISKSTEVVPMVVGPVVVGHAAQMPKWISPRQIVYVARPEELPSAIDSLVVARAHGER
jgi:hypothetical protein